MSSHSVSREHARMEYEMVKENREVRDREQCKECGNDVPDEDYSWKFMQAGGVLDGPYCSSECYWGSLA